MLKSFDLILVDHLFYKIYLTPTNIKSCNKTYSMYLIFTTSLRPGSHAKIMANVLLNNLKEKNQDAELIDLFELELPFCDGDKCYDHENVKSLKKKVETAKGIIIATPIYNYDANAAAKNLIELIGKSLMNKVVGFVCAAGGQRSYMSIMNLANDLMLDFRCIIIPKFVYATDEAFIGDDITDEQVSERLQELADSLIKFSEALS